MIRTKNRKNITTYGKAEISTTPYDPEVIFSVFFLHIAIFQIRFQIKKLL